MAGVLDLPTLLQRVRLDADTSKGEQDAKSAAQRVGASLTKVGAGLTAGLTLPIIGLATAGVKAASDLGESASKVGVVFGENANQVRAFAKTTASELGISEQAALEATGTFGNLFRALGIGTKPAADMSQSLVTLAADLASFNNANPEDVLLALRSGLLGEAEPLRQFGVSLSAARIEAEALASGLVKPTANMEEIGSASLKVEAAAKKAAEATKAHGKESIEARKAQDDLRKAEEALSKATEGRVPELNAAQKAQAAYAIIQKDTALAQGDFARTSSGLANQQRIMAAEFENVKATLGTSLLPLMTSAVGFVNRLLTAFQGLSPEGQKIAKIGLVIAAGLGPALIVIGKLVPAIGSGISAVGSLVKGIGSFAAGAARFVSSAASMVASAASTAASMVAQGARMVASFVATAASAVASAAATAAAWLVAAAPFIAIGVVIAGVALVIVKNWDTIKAATVAVWGAIVDAVTTAASAVANVVKAAFEVIRTIVVAYVTSWRVIIETAWNVIRTIVSTVVGAIRAVIETTFGVIRAVIEREVNGFRKIIETAWAGIRFIIESVLGAIRLIVESVLGVIRGIIEREANGFHRIIETAWGLIRGVFQSVLDGIRLIVSGVLGGITLYIQGWVSIVKGVLGVGARIFGGIEDAIRAAKDVVVGAVDGIVDFVGGIAGRIAGVARGAFDGLVDAFRNAINTIIRGWNGLQFKVPGFKVGPVSFGGFTLGLPKVPLLGGGGFSSQSFNPNPDVPTSDALDAIRDLTRGAPTIEERIAANKWLVDLARDFMRRTPPPAPVAPTAPPPGPPPVTISSPLVSVTIAGDVSDATVQKMGEVVRDAFQDFLTELEAS